MAFNDLKIRKLGTYVGIFEYFLRMLNKVGNILCN